MPEHIGTSFADLPCTPHEASPTGLHVAELWRIGRSSLKLRKAVYYFIGCSTYSLKDIHAQDLACVDLFAGKCSVSNGFGLGLTIKDKPQFIPKACLTYCSFDVHPNLRGIW